MSKSKTTFEAWLKRNAGKQSRRGPQCGVCKLPPKTLTAVKTARAGGMTYSLISLGLRRAKIIVGPEALSRHFRDDHEDTRIELHG